MPDTELRGSLPRTIARGAGGLALGALTAVAEILYVVSGTLALALPPARPGVWRGARALADLEVRRLRRYFGLELPAGRREGHRDLGYLASRCVIGAVAAGIFLLIIYGAVSVVLMLGQITQGRPVGGGETGSWYDSITVVLLGLLLAFLAVQGLFGVATLDQRLARRFLGPSEQERLRARVSELATTRAEVIEEVNRERRRIERDLHDGVQQRIVALGMLIGRSRRATDPARSAELLAQAHEEVQEALRDLREVTWRVYPVALDEKGLATALEAVAERSSIPVRLAYRLTGRLPLALETVAYFVVSEAVTNALKHACASRIDLSVTKNDGTILVEITDDGRGGALLSGAGLSGLARRVAAADGRFTVDSPAGGPTHVRAELPCD